jgi:hypothetical protein
LQSPTWLRKPPNSTPPDCKQHKKSRPDVQPSYYAHNILPTTLTLHDINDVEAFAERAVQRCGLTEYGYLDREDLLADCITFIWELSQNGKYNPALGSFSHTAGARLNHFIVNWKRSQYRTRWVFKDRIHERTPPTFTTLDNRPEHPHNPEPLDAAGSELQDLLGLQRTRDRNHPPPPTTHHPT